MSAAAAALAVFATAVAASSAWYAWLYGRIVHRRPLTRFQRWTLRRLR